jgi:nucleotide-binding universal stress UspA family protein
MFKKVLVAVDMSSFGEQVFEAALAVAQKDTEGKLLLLHVLSPEEDDSPLPIPENLRDIYPAQGNDFTLSQWRQQWEDFAEGGINRLQNYQKRAQAAGVSTDYEQVYGSPAKTICKIAQKEEINLITIGRRGRSGVSEMLLGSVSNYVLHHAPCAVLIVQGRS